MRPLALLAAAIPFALGCAQQSLSRPADVPTDRPLQVQLKRPTGGGLAYSLSEPAYVAIFSVSRGHDIRLVYPRLESQVRVASHAGVNQLTRSGQGSVSLYDIDRRHEQRGILAQADAYYIIASKRPLIPVAEMIRSPFVLGSFVDRFRATNLSSVGEAIAAALVAELPDGEWAEDTYLSSRLPFESLAAMQKAFMRNCPAKGVASVPMTVTAQCESRSRGN